jgi:hypothetical protein
MTQGVTGCSLVDSELDLLFSDKSALPSEHMRRHLESCKRCRRLFEWTREELVDRASSPRLDSKIQEMLKPSLRPLPAWPSVGSLALQFSFVFLLLAAAASAMVGIAGIRQMSFSQIAGMGVVLTLSLALATSSLAWQITPGSRQRYSPSLVAPIVALCFIAGSLLFFSWRAPDEFFVRGWHCFKTGLVIACASALAYWPLTRRGVALNVRPFAATLGGLAGLTGIAVLQVCCSHQDVGHLAVWHGTVLAGSILVGVGTAQALLSF